MAIFIDQYLIAKCQHTLMELNISNIFATRLGFARKVKRLSQEKLGILVGSDESSTSARMNQYERGKYTPYFLLASQIAKILEFPLSFFMHPQMT